jgi:hypothetical protein
MTKTAGLDNITELSDEMVSLVSLVDEVALAIGNDAEKAELFAVMLLDTVAAPAMGAMAPMDVAPPMGDMMAPLAPEPMGDVLGTDVPPVEDVAIPGMETEPVVDEVGEAGEEEIPEVGEDEVEPLF